MAEAARPATKVPSVARGEIPAELVVHTGAVPVQTNHPAQLGSELPRFRGEFPSEADPLQGDNGS